MRINYPLIKCVYKLGITNVIRVIFYRVCLKTGYYKYKLPIKKFIVKELFITNIDFNRDSSYTIDYFSKHPVVIKGSPNWFSNPWKPAAQDIHGTDHWSEFSDFDNQIGDIKTVWELSRFDWAPKMAWEYRQESESSASLASLARLEFWLRDWTKKNPINQGVNWKCGQEASLRALNLLVTSKIIDSSYESPTTGVINFFVAHLERILPTTHYAKAQDNNHGTSEAIALFCIGSYLQKYGTDENYSIARKSKIVGRKLLEDRVKKLIFNDGTFSQNSLTYHRLFLDTMCLCEITRILHNEKKFSHHLYSKLSAATSWLDSMLDLDTGDGPNIGPNDGAYFLNIENKPYRDFKSTLKRSLVLFDKRNLPYPNTDALLNSYGIDYAHLDHHTPNGNRFFADGGYARFVLEGDRGYLIFRFPKYQFRPSGCDAAHLDLWLDGKNITLDSGSYSYNTGDTDLQKYFGSTESHCTVQFDDHEQMPKLSRMLRGHWLNADYIECDVNLNKLVTQYTDYKGCVHTRKVVLLPDCLTVTDEVSKFEKMATIIWRLPIMDWERQGSSFKANNIKLDFYSTDDYEIVLEQADNSRYYLHKEKIMVIKIICKVATTVVTKIDFGQ